MPKIIKGPKAILLFILYLFLNKKTKKIPTPAPSQKLIIKAQIPFSSPKNQPRPSANLASPKPIPLPLVKNQIAAKKTKKATPARKLEIWNLKFET